MKKRLFLAVALASVIVAVPFAVSSAAGARSGASTQIYLDPSYSFDGTQIVFRSLRDKNSVIYMMNRDGTGVTRVSDPAGRAPFASFCAS